VTKLLHIVKPHVAVFGQKDAQQVAVLRTMVRDLNMDIDLVVAPTVRESDGLARSSRNVYLTPDQRAEAPVLFQALQIAEKRLQQGASSSRDLIGEMADHIRTNSHAEIEYISVADAGTLQELADIPPGQEVLISLAVRFGGTRLIDNVIGIRGDNGI
jgi:pantoate--beta-alanine ligase